MMNSFMIAWCINPWGFATCSMFWPWSATPPQPLRHEEDE